MLKKYYSMAVMSNIMRLTDEKAMGTDLFSYNALNSSMVSTACRMSFLSRPGPSSLCWGIDALVNETDWD